MGIIGTGFKMSFQQWQSTEDHCTSPHYINSPTYP